MPEQGEERGGEGENPKRGKGKKWEGKQGKRWVGRKGKGRGREGELKEKKRGKRKEREWEGGPRGREQDFGCKHICSPNTAPILSTANEARAKEETKLRIKSRDLSGLWRGLGGGGGRALGYRGSALEYR